MEFLKKIYDIMEKVSSFLSTIGLLVFIPYLITLIVLCFYLKKDITLSNLWYLRKLFCVQIFFNPSCLKLYKQLLASKVPFYDLIPSSIGLDLIIYDELPVKVALEQYNNLSNETNIEKFNDVKTYIDQLASRYKALNEMANDKTRLYRIPSSKDLKNLKILNQLNLIHSCGVVQIRGLDSKTRRLMSSSVINCDIHDHRNQ